jgi:hypothetical protein
MCWHCTPSILVRGVGGHAGDIALKPSPRNARAMRLMKRTGDSLFMNQRYGGPDLGEYGSEARAIGKQIGLTRQNAQVMIRNDWIAQVNEPEDHWENAEFKITASGTIILLSLNEVDFHPPRPYFTADEVKAILRDWYVHQGGYIFLTELTINDRRVDAYALGLWESMKFQAIGFEVKISRPDLLADLKHPPKREAVMRACHQFYYVTTKGLANQFEIPEDCGLIEIWEDKHRHVILDAPIRDIGPPTWKFSGVLALRALKEYFKHYDWNTGEWVGEDRPLPESEMIN